MAHTLPFFEGDSLFYPTGACMMLMGITLLFLAAPTC